MEQEYFYINKNNPQIAYLKFYENKTISAEYSVLKENIIKSIIIDKSPSDNAIKILKRKLALQSRDILRSLIDDFKTTCRCRVCRLSYPH